MMWTNIPPAREGRYQLMVCSGIYAGEHNTPKVYDVEVKQVWPQESEDVRPILWYTTTDGKLEGTVEPAHPMFLWRGPMEKGENK